MSFQALGLKPELLRAITSRGYKATTPIQAKAIPPILSGRDVMAGAQTGTGKTAAFCLPILQILNATPRKGRNPRALVLTPTRELAAQVLEFTEHYGKSLTLRAAAIFGGVNIRPQISKLKHGTDILIATPGRLLDHISQKTLSLSDIEILVLDEADRMMDMGFSFELKRILKLIPKKRQNLLFSATYSDEIKQLADQMLQNPVTVEVATQNSTADTVDQVIHPVEHEQKQELLSKLIREGKWKQTLVFTRTKHGANRLAKELIADNITAAAIHGNKSQAQRTSALADFKNGKLRVLVATDIAARGLDINLLAHVVNYELPDTPENYIHRIGRTGRAGAKGNAISLVCPDENYELHAIHRLLKREIPIVKIDGFDAQILTTAGQSKRKRSTSRGGNRNQSNNASTGRKPKRSKQPKSEQQNKKSYTPKPKKKSTDSKPKQLGKKVWRRFNNSPKKTTANKN